MDGVVGIHEYSFLPDQSLSDYLSRYDASQTAAIGFATKRFSLRENDAEAKAGNPLTAPAFPDPLPLSSNGGGPVFFGLNTAGGRDTRLFPRSAGSPANGSKQGALSPLRGQPRSVGSGPGRPVNATTPPENENLVKMKNLVDRALSMAGRGEASRAEKHPWLRTGQAGYPRMDCFLNQYLVWQFRKVLLIRGMRPQRYLVFV